MQGRKPSGTSDDPAAGELPDRVHEDALEAAELVGIHLREATFSVTDGAAAEAAAASFGPTVRRIAFDSRTGRCSLVVAWSLTAPVARRPASLNAEATFLVLYGGLTGMPAQIVEPLVDQLGRFASFPYFRAYVAQMAGMSGFAIPPLPILKGRVDPPFPVGGGEAVQPPRRRKPPG